ncbi:MAG: DUF3301 domain-containing protein [Steroidobacteraceae bacterium]
MLSWTLLGAVIVALLAGWFWYDSLKQRERANAAAQEACERAHLQFLDGTVAFARMSFFRGASGRLALRRTYVFDYTARSIERLQGFVVIAGNGVETVGFAHAPLTEPVERPTVTDHPPARSLTVSRPPSNVLDLDQWRRQRQRSAPPDQPRRSDSGDGRV